MRILIDVDGVILNTQEALLKRLNNRYDTRYTLENVTHYHWFENVYKNINPWAELEDKTFWQEEVSLIKGAKEAVNKILSQGHEVYFITASNVFNPAFAEKMTCLRELLNVSEDWFNDHTIIAQNKAMIVGDILIDDNLKQIENFAEFNSGFVLLFKQPWNENSEYQGHTWHSLENLFS